MKKKKKRKKKGQDALRRNEYLQFRLFMKKFRCITGESNQPTDVRWYVRNF